MQDNKNAFEPNKHTDNDIIDISMFVHKFYLFLSGIGKRYRLVKTIIVTNFLLLGAIVFVGGAAGYFSAKNMTPEYHYSMTLNSTILDHFECEQMIDELKEITTDRSFPELAKYLGMTKEEVKSVNRIDFRIIGITGDSIHKYYSFEVLMRVSSNKIVRKLERGIVNYLRNNEYAKQREEFNIAQANGTVKQIESEILEINGLKKLITKGLEQANTQQSSLVFAERIDPINVYRESFKLFEKELITRRELYTSYSSSIHIVKRALIKRKPDYPMPSKFAIGGGALLGIVGLAVLYRRERKKMA